MEARWQRNGALRTTTNVGITGTWLIYRQYGLQIKTDSHVLPLLHTNRSQQNLQICCSALNTSTTNHKRASGARFPGIQDCVIGRALPDVPWDFKAIKMLGTTHSMAWTHIPGDRNPQHQSCEDLTISHTHT